MRSKIRFHRGQEPEALEKELLGTFQTNAIGNIHLINVFMPLILQGSAKKVIALSTGLGDIDLIRNHDIWMGVAYSISKAALNMVIAKFSAQYREEGILFLGISPGVVNTTDTSDCEFILHTQFGFKLDLTAIQGLSLPLKSCWKWVLNSPSTLRIGKDPFLRLNQLGWSCLSLRRLTSRKETAVISCLI